ncbi:MAG: guanylate kinase [Chlamydiales bacterium]|nr:guanylate kinase [Chlamydiales bacterium]
MSKKVLGNKGEGLLFVISAPAGTGKSTLVEMILKEFPDEIAESCSSTTREPRPGEIAERHYEFISIQEFETKVEAGEFLEHAKVFGNYYGTRKEEIDRLLQEGKHVVLVIDTQGAMQIFGKVPATFIFISPPSFEELRKRLFKRRTENEEKIQERLLWAKQEIALAPRYDYHIINDDLEVTYQILRSIFIAEEHKRR